MTGSLDRLALKATLQCLTGCALGELSGMAIALAYLFGFGLMALPLVRAGLGWRQVVTTGLAADTVSITIIAFPFAYLANRYLIARGRGHAFAHGYH